MIPAAVATRYIYRGLLFGICSARPIARSCCVSFHAAAPLNRLCYTPHPGAYPGIAALCPASEGIAGFYNGYAPVFGT